MCGIAGFIDPRGDAGDSLRAMTARMQLRGPDGEGFFVDGPVHLGHRRLSILDLAGGAQPMQRGELVVTFNGEIYNFAQLRAELEKVGQRFSTRSDTEVLLALHAEHGDRAVPLLDGMFAYALWDRARQRLVLARDRFGKKPLYYYQEGRRFYFASTLSALLAHPFVPRAIDDDALDEYLALEYVVAPRALCQGIKKLAAGSWLTFDPATGQCDVERYWELFVDGKRQAGVSEVDAADELERLLDGAVQKRMVADVPVGVFLSGGLDSSTVAALASRHQKIRTFSVAFADPSFDESRFARRVAAHIGSEHHEAELTEADTLGIVDQLGDILDEPIGDASIVPTYLLSRFARTEVTVALGGDGGDELFGGYPTYVAHRLAGWAERFGSLGRWSPLLRRAAQLLPVSHDNFSFDFKLKKLLAGLDAPLDVRNAVWMGADTLDGIARLRGRPAADPYLAVRAAYARAGNTHLERVMGQDVRLYMAHAVLAKVDRASMAASLEVRAPLLDTEVAEFAARLPMQWKLRGLDGKYLLKRVGERLLPHDIVHRKKKGFGMPVGRWLRGPLAEKCRALTTDGDSLVASGRFRRSEVERLLDEHQRGLVDHRQRLWTLMVLEQWRRTNRIAA